MKHTFLFLLSIIKHFYPFRNGYLILKEVPGLYYSEVNPANESPNRTGIPFFVKKKHFSIEKSGDSNRHKENV